MSKDFLDRIGPNLPAIADRFGTPFHIYDEAGIRQTCKKMAQAFKDAGLDYRNYFAVKALPNPAITQIVANEGMGFDCSSIPELRIARMSGAQPDDIMFTSNNTSPEEFDEAAKTGCILNLDDISLIDKVPAPFPELICFRYNPGDRRVVEDKTIGEPSKAKYGVPHEVIVEAYRRALARGATRFGLHTMLASNTLKPEFIIGTARMLLEVAELLLSGPGIKLEFINIGGGIGIPYLPGVEPISLDVVAHGIAKALKEFEEKNGYRPKLLTECGRYVAGPHGVLITRVINVTQKYLELAGVDASASSLMRPLMYGAYHHVTVVGKENEPVDKAMVVHGSICEGIDKFTPEPRPLPKIAEGDLIAIHDTGAHGIAMGFNYNGRLRPQELLLCKEGEVRQIRRAETVNDYFATLQGVNAMPFQLNPKKEEV